MKQRIAINTRLLLKDKLEGIGWFTYESLKRIVTEHPEVEFHFIFDRAWDDSFIFSDNVIPHKIFPPARHPFLMYAWYEQALPRLLKKINPDLFVSPDALTSLTAKVKKLTVIHDINFEHYPEQMPKLYAMMYKMVTPRIAKESDRIATVSYFSKKDIVEHYEVPEAKIDVVYNGANPRFHPLSETEKEKVRKAYAGGSEYFVFVGALNPRKNLQNMFKAFDRFKSSVDSDVKYLIVGEKMYWSKEIKSAYENMKHQKDVIFLGRLGPEELNQIVSSAVAITYASLFEGFGIPIVESFYAETPVITSKVSSMPEVAGDAALLVDPLNPQSIGDAMMKIYRDLDLRKRLVEKGRERKRKFTWEKTAENFWKSMQKTMNE
jgi:glycosyltransferase involved in cell wall biosynthesis